MRKILIVAPHCDDAEYGLGGCLARWADDPEAQTHVAVLSAGGYMRQGKMITLSMRLDEQQAAMKELGVDQWWLDKVAEENQFPDSYSVIATKFDALFAEGWDDLYIPLPSFNQDHRVTYEAALTALRKPASGPARIWAYEYPGNAWAYPGEPMGRQYRPLDRAHIDRKLSALLHHRSQEPEVPGLVSSDSALRLAEQRGLECASAYAECFWLIREIAR